MSELKSYTQPQRFFRYAYNGKHDPSAYFNEKFLTFNWRGENSWVDYGCFIINNKNDLHWVGQSSKNNYSSPLYGSNTQTLSSVTFDVTKISLKLGLYGITKQDYAKFFAWMDPLIIDKFYFDYDNKYYYKLKVSSLKESTKYVLGYQNDKELYYVETSVEFEIQGENCGWGDQIINWKFTPYSRDGVWYRELMNRNKNLDNAEWISELRNGIEVQIVNLNSEILSSESLILQIIAEEMDTIKEQEPGYNKKILCELGFKQYGELPVGGFSFIYDSSDGIVFSSEDKVLFSFSSARRYLEKLNVSKFLLPSKLQDRNFYVEWPNSTIKRDVQLRILGKKSSGEIKILQPLKDAQNNFNGFGWVDRVDNNEKNIKICDDILITSQLKTPLI